MVERFDPFSPEVKANPYPVYAAMRQEAPVYWSEGQLSFVLTRYADCVDVLRDSRSSTDNANSVRSAEQRAALGMDDLLTVFDVGPMLFTDPPDHARLRGLVNKAFTPRRVEELRPHIGDIVDGLLDGVAGRGAMDVVADLAFPLPVIVIAELLGVPLEDREQLKGWSRDLARTIDPVVSLETAQQAAMSGLMFVNYLNHLIDERRAQPRDDLLSALIAAEDQGETLTHQELLVNSILLFIAGHETTQNLIGNGLLALLRHPEQFDKLRADPSLAKNAVEEMLRYDGPIQLTARHMLEDVEIDGTVVPKGETAITVLAAADRDPDQFEDPDRFDITRPDANRNIAFGHGIHHCLGAPLARVEAQVAVSALLARFPDLALADPDPPYGDMFTLRGVATLPVTF